MKKATLSSIATLVFLLLTSAVCFITKPFFSSFDVTILIALGIITVSAIVAFLIRKSNVMNVICFLVSSVAFGIAMRAWYIFLGVECDLVRMAILSLGVALLFFIFGSIISIRAIREHKVVYIILIVLYVLFDAFPVYLAIALSGNVYLSTIAFFLIATWGFILPLAVESDDATSFIRNLALATYSVMVAIIVIIIVAIALAGGGDVSDDGDVDCCCDSDSEGCCDTIGERIRDARDDRRSRRDIRRSQREAEREWFGR
jgi:hypothetical protein